MRFLWHRNRHRIVTVLSGRPLGFRKGDTFGRGLPSDKAKAAAIARWHGRRDERAKASRSRKATAARQ